MKQGHKIIKDTCRDANLHMYIDQHLIKMTNGMEVCALKLS